MHSDPNIIELDARGFEPPQPLLKTLEAVATLPAGATLSGPWSCLASAGSSCSAATGGTTGGNTVSLTVNLLANGTATITVPVAFNANAGAY